MLDLPLEPAWELPLGDRSAVVLEEGDLDVVDAWVGPLRTGTLLGDLVPEPDPSLGATLRGRLSD